jgi:hypothetical protein
MFVAPSGDLNLSNLRNLEKLESDNATSLFGGRALAQGIIGGGWFVE